MKTLTIKNHEYLRTTTTIQADEYVYIALQLLDMNITLDNDSADELCYMAYQESKVIGADELCRFTDYYYWGENMLVGKLSIDTYIVLVADGNRWTVEKWTEEKNSHEIGMFLESL